MKRALRLLGLLQERPSWSGEDLAPRLGVTARTLRNDVRRLRELGCSVERVPGRAAGYRLRPGPAIPPLLFDDDETVAALTGLRLLAATSLGGLDEAAGRALRKALRGLPERLAGQAEAVAVFLDADSGLESDPEPEPVRTLVTACRARSRVRFAYGDREFPSFHDVEPYRVLSVQGRWHLLAWDTGTRDWRVFRVDRVALPGDPGGPRFEPRALPSEDPVSWVLSRIPE